MENEELTQQRLYKYNNWGERLLLVCNDQQKIDNALAKATNSSLSLPEKSIQYVNALTGCRGFEFVAFSNAKFNSPVLLASDVILYPCFLPDVSGCDISDPHCQATVKMIKKARYIYDGWLPIKNMVEDEIRVQLIRLREALAIFSIVSGSYFEWEPKYSPVNSSIETHYLGQKELATTELFSQTISAISVPDRTALLRSIGWLSRSLQQREAEAKLLFAILAIESLCTYIEVDADDDSAFINLRLDKKSKSERRSARATCITGILDEMLETNPTRAIETAYFTCVVGIKTRLKEHLEQVMGSTHSGIGLFFDDTSNEKSLYNLRHTIAHGFHDVLRDEDLVRIGKNVFAVERFAGQYIWSILQRAFSFYNLSETINASIGSDLFDSISSGIEMYKGPIDIGIIYTLR
jgi:hypothetical protein